jgi:cysteine desulfurase/selenocysteine lyase
MNAAVESKLSRDAQALSNAPLDVEAVRREFPILSRTVYGDRPLVYLDSGASAQKPRQVIDTMREVMEAEYANVHRGVHYLSQHLSDRYEAVRGKVAGLLNAPSPDQIVFTRNATAAINLVAQSYGRHFLEEGDEVVISHMEHHANIVPWQMLRDEIGIVLKVVPVDDRGVLHIDALEKMLGKHTRLVAITHASNVLGTITPAKAIAALAHEHGAVCLFDGSQAVVHSAVDVQDIDADFYVFTGHKLYGPTGVGVLYGKKNLLSKMPPCEGGGDMILSVTLENSVYQVPPYRFEAGTPPIVEVVGLGAAIDYVQSIGMARIAAHEHDLLTHATERLKEVPGLRVIGEARDKCAIVSFDLEGVHAHDVGTILDRAGVAVRAGHHCAQPVMSRFGLTASSRASFAMYNTREEVDVLVDAVLKVKEIFG